MTDSIREELRHRDADEEAVVVIFPPHLSVEQRQQLGKTFLGLGVDIVGSSTVQELLDEKDESITVTDYNTLLDFAETINVHKSTVARTYRRIATTGRVDSRFKGISIPKSEGAPLPEGHNRDFYRDNFLIDVGAFVDRCVEYDIPYVRGIGNEASRLIHEFIAARQIETVDEATEEPGSTSFQLG